MEEVIAGILHAVAVQVFPPAAAKIATYFGFGCWQAP
jgi:hypothetical protein